MILTEKDAKQKICPFMTTDNPEASLIKCEASKCMAWRWSTHPNKSGDTYTVIVGIPPRPEERKYKDCHEGEGYCGAAVRP